MYNVNIPSSKLGIPFNANPKLLYQLAKLLFVQISSPTPYMFLPTFVSVNDNCGLTNLPVLLLYTGFMSKSLAVEFTISISV